MSFRFVHAADLHLDAPLRGLSASEMPPHIQRRVRMASREALRKLVSAVVDEQAAFVVIAGDVFDGERPDYRTGLFFVEQMGRLHREGIAVFVLYGNHDAQASMSRQLPLPDNVRIFPHETPVTFRVPEFNVALHGQSYATREVKDNMAASFPAPIEGAFNIGVLHTALDPSAETYAPCRLSDLVDKGYQYWALGHVHGRKILHRHPHVAFSGTLQGRHVHETGPKGAYVIPVDDHQLRAEPKEIDTQSVRWERITVRLQEHDDSVERVSARVGRALQPHAEEANVGRRLLICRAELQGNQRNHEALRQDVPRLEAEIRADAMGHHADTLWVDRVDLRLTPSGPLSPSDGEHSPSPFLPGLWSDISPSERRQLAATLADRFNRLPEDVMRASNDPVLTALANGDGAPLLEDLLTDLQGRLRSTER